LLYIKNVLDFQQTLTN